MTKNVLDERQEQKLLKIEHNGTWFCFWSLLAAVIIQKTFLGMPFVQYAGEFIILIILAGYLLIGCLKEGIWDRHLRPTLKTNLIASAIAAIAFSSILTITQYFKYEVCRDNITFTLGIFGIMAVSLFVLSFVVLWLCSRIYHKRRNWLEDSCENDGPRE